ncbi:hypothetical protein, partial [Chania multitudinisentens]
RMPTDGSEDGMHSGAPNISPEFTNSIYSGGATYYNGFRTVGLLWPEWGNMNQYGWSPDPYTFYWTSRPANWSAHHAVSNNGILRNVPDINILPVICVKDI